MRVRVDPGPTLLPAGRFEHPWLHGSIQAPRIRQSGCPEFPVDFPPDLADHLDALTDALDGSGDDLQAILSVLCDDLRAAVPSFVGLSVTVQVAGGPVTVVAVNSRSAAASMLLPLSHMTGLPGGSRMIFYADAPGAFVKLAADARAAYGLDGDVVLDQHLPPPNPIDTGIDRLTRRSEIEQAVGVLIDRGRTPDQARAELEYRAAATGTPVHRVAQDILVQLGGAGGIPDC